MKEMGEVYLLTCYNVGWGNLNLKMNKKMNYYTLWNPKKNFFVRNEISMRR
jgi:hypothetical protein